MRLYSSNRWYRVFLAQTAALMMILLAAGLLAAVSARAETALHRSASPPAGADLRGVPRSSQPATTTIQTDPDDPFFLEATFSAVPLAQSSSLFMAAEGDVLEVFTNTWSYSTIGLVYDPDRGVVRYAHESQSSSHRPTIYDVSYSTAPNVERSPLLSIALSTVNSGWPWQIDNRTGAGYDPVAQTTFLPDYNGDLSYADDNIVEIDAGGTILNAWEMDDEVGSNDSADGSEIDSIIDIAVVPGNPSRYFVAAAYDDNVVYEIELNRTGVWWTPNSWRTVATYTISPLRDNLGIDYDAQNGYLYHSGWHTTTIVVTDLEGQEIRQFDCPGAGGYNSGVTFIEGSDPPEVWVTDFSSDKTTRCQTEDVPLPPTGWTKTVNGTPWTAGLTVSSETTATVQVVDVITAGRAFTLTEQWDPARLAWQGVEIDPPLVKLITATGMLTISGGEAAPNVVTVTKQFQTQPSTWTLTVVTETLTIINSEFNRRLQSFTVTKELPQLEMTSRYRTEVLPGNVATFTLSYSNTGGYENDVLIRNEFPVSAPFVFADPQPIRRAADGSWAEWEVGDLPRDAGGAIDVYVYISATLTISTPVTIWDGIYNHAGELADEVLTSFHVDAEAPTGWTKTIDGLNWSPTLSVTAQVSETFEVVDVISVTEPFLLAELWNPNQLALESWSVEPIIYASSIVVLPGSLDFGVIIPPTGPITLTKLFALQPCTWTQTLLWEQFGSWPSALYRPVPVNKRPPQLWLAGETGSSAVDAGQTTTYTLRYGNDGGAENLASIQAHLPAEISFVSAEPPPDSGGPGDSTLVWDLPDGLAEGQAGQITVTVTVAESVPPQTILSIPNLIFDHAGVERDRAVVTYQVTTPVWNKWINGQAWRFDLSTPVDAGEVITVTDIVTSGSGFSLIDRWPAGQLALLSAQPEQGSVMNATGRLTWTVEPGLAGGVALTRRFRVLPFTQTYTVLWEDLWVGGAEWERRPVLLDKLAAEVWLEKRVTPAAAPPGQQVIYTLAFSNSGPGTAAGVVITDQIPAGLIETQVDSRGPAITETGAAPAYAWQVADLAAGEGGVITITGRLSPTLPPGGTLLNTAGITLTGAWDSDLSNNTAAAPVIVGELRYYFPLILKEAG